MQPTGSHDDHSSTSGRGELAALLRGVDGDREFCEDTERGRNEEVVHQPHLCKAAIRLALGLGLAISVVLLFGVGDRPLIDSSAISRLRIQFWYDSDYSAIDSKVQGRLWNVERTLVDKNLCPPATPEVEKLRGQSWPRPNAEGPPKIGKIMYINLDWDTARKDFMEDQLRGLNKAARKEGREFDWQRIPGVSSHDMKNGDACATWMQDRGFSTAADPNVFDDWRTAGCACGHYHAIKQVPQGSDYEVSVILEDDAEVVPDFFDAFERLWPFVPEQWDVLRLGWFSDNQNCSQVVNSRIDRAGWQSPRQGSCAYCGAQAYVINPQSKERVLQRFENSRITHADELLGAPTPQLEDPSLVPPLRSFVAWPTLAKTHLGPAGEPVFQSDRVVGRMQIQRAASFD